MSDKIEVGFNFQRAQRDAQQLAKFMNERLNALAAEGSSVGRYADAISVMDPVDAFAFIALTLLAPCDLPPLE